MSEFASFLERAKDISPTILVVGVSVFFLVKYMPSMMKQQGMADEVIRHSSQVIANNTEVLRLVTARDAETRDSLERIEKRVDEINLDVHEIKTKQTINQQRRD